MAEITGYNTNRPRSITRLIEGQGTKVLLMATSDHLSQSSYKRWMSHKQLFHLCWGSSVRRTDGEV